YRGPVNLLSRAVFSSARSAGREHPGRCCGLMQSLGLGVAMRQSIRRGGWVLLAAGALSLASRALAAEPEAAARAEEREVELAWLADPGTFAYALAARADGMVLVVRGYVPSDEARRRAIEVAKAHTTRAIADGLQLSPGVALGQTVVRPSE